MQLSDSGRILRAPIRLFYLINGLLFFLPLLFALFNVKECMGMGLMLGMLKNTFWHRYVISLDVLLLLYALLMIGIVGFGYWRNRYKNLRYTVENGSHYVALPLLGDLIQSWGECISLFIGFFAIVGSILYFLTCLLTRSVEFSAYCGNSLFAIVIAFVIAYLNLFITRIVAERIRVWTSMSNDIRRIATGLKPLTKDEEKADYVVETPAFGWLTKKFALLVLVLAPVVALILAWVISEPPFYILDTDKLFALMS